MAKAPKGAKGTSPNGKEGGGQNGTQTVTHTFQSIEDFLRFVLQGGQSGG